MAQPKPNILVLMLDDVGFAQLGSYGGLVETPNIDALASQGLRYTNFHTTPICSASRAAFLTGRNPHAIHVGGHAAIAMPHPGYDGKIPPSAGTIAANLREAGYITYAVGKWDHLPVAHTSESGPFTYWPSGQGFDRYYGFLAAETDQVSPVLWAGHAPLQGRPQAGEHLTSDLADRAIEMIRSRTAEQQRPFFMYWAPGAAHAPHQAPDKHLAKYRGRFDAGWDEAREEILNRQIDRGLVPQGTRLPPRPAGMPAWASLSREQKRTYARSMEAFAAYLTYADAEFGRIIDALKQQGELDRTIIVVTSDNGASAEGAYDGAYNETLFSTGRHPSPAENAKYLNVWGTAATYPHYPLGWAIAGNTPFRYYKATTYEGGARVPLIISWTGGISARGQIRGQFAYITDLAPTLLEAAGVNPPPEIAGVRQSHFDGRSLAATFSGGSGSEASRAQYLEIFGAQAIWKDGWKGVNPHRFEPWKLDADLPFKDAWELYDLRRDINEMENLAEKEPQRLRELKRAFQVQASANNVFPLMNSAAGIAERRVQVRREFEARNGVWRYPTAGAYVPSASAPPVLNRSYVMTARITPAVSKASGPVFAYGGVFGGVALYLDEGRPTFAYRDFDGSLTRVAAQAPLQPGGHELKLVFRVESGGAKVQLLSDGAPLVSGEIPKDIVPNVAPNEFFDLGSDSGRQVDEAYGAVGFPGRIEDVRFDFNQ